MSSSFVAESVKAPTLGKRVKMIIKKSPLRALPDDQFYDGLTPESAADILQRVKENSKHGRRSLVIFDDVQSGLKDPETARSVLDLIGNMRHSGSSATRAFGKLETGSKKAFGKLDHVASVVAGGVTQAADKVLVVAKKSGNVLEKVGAAVSMINPVVGAGIMSAGAGAKLLSNQARTTGKAIVGAAKMAKGDIKASFA
ncbi:hypothetical protein B484DRAFT_404109 [Ochromonadaceae sp. CCMP2298]|nr:hypothetical protein B484DRAFT_404109 [Ochromonadaceae sp. CCMP2298]